jgi:HD-like signal output (HDOD) protein
MSIPETPLFAKVIEEIIDESQAVAKICRLLAPVFSIDANEAFLAGLLHNIGKIGLLKQISNHYNVPDDLDIEYHQSLFKSILPVFAARAAEKIGQYWKLDKRIIQAISKHSELNSLIREGFRIEDVKLIALVNLSIYIARILGFGESLSNGADIFGQVSSKVLGMSDTPAYRLLLKNLSKAFSEEELPKVAVA